MLKNAFSQLIVAIFDNRNSLLPLKDVTDSFTAEFPTPNNNSFETREEDGQKSKSNFSSSQSPIFARDRDEDVDNQPPPPPSCSQPTPHTHTTTTTTTHLFNLDHSDRILASAVGLISQTSATIHHNILSLSSSVSSVSYAFSLSNNPPSHFPKPHQLNKSNVLVLKPILDQAFADTYGSYSNAQNIVRSTNAIDSMRQTSKVKFDAAFALLFPEKARGKKRGRSPVANGGVGATTEEEAKKAKMVLKREMNEMIALEVGKDLLNLVPTI